MEREDGRIASDGEGKEKTGRWRRRCCGWSREHGDGGDTPAVRGSRRVKKLL